MKKNVTKQNRYRIVLRGSLGMLIILALLLVACGGASSSESSGASVNAPSHQVASTSSQGSSSSSGQTSKSSTSFRPQYLIKSLQVNMLVKDTRQVARDLQSWIATTDPRSTSAGIDYEQITEQLQEEGVQKFIDSFDKLFQCIEDKRKALQEKTMPHG